MSTILRQVSSLCTDILILRMAMRQLTLHGYIHNPLIFSPYECHSETLMMESSTQRKRPPGLVKAELRSIVLHCRLLFECALHVFEKTSLVLEVVYCHKMGKNIYMAYLPFQD